MQPVSHSVPLSNTKVNSSGGSEGLSHSLSPVRKAPDKPKHHILSFDIDGTLTPECLYEATPREAEYFIRRVSLTSGPMIEAFAQKFAEKLPGALPLKTQSGTGAFIQEAKNTAISSLTNNKDKSLFENVVTRDIYNSMNKYFKNEELFNSTINQAAIATVQELLQEIAQDKGVTAFDPNVKIQQFKAPHEISHTSGMMFAGAKKLLEDTKNAMLQFAVPGAIVHVVLISNGSKPHVESFAKHTELENLLVSEMKGVDSPIQSRPTEVMLKHIQSRQPERGSQLYPKTSYIQKPNMKMLNLLANKLGILREDIGHFVHIGNSALSDGNFVENVRSVLPKPEAVEFIHFTPEEDCIPLHKDFGYSVRSELYRVLSRYRRLEAVEEIERMKRQ